LFPKAQVIQSGGHTLNRSTLQALKITKEQGKMAIEGLKQDLRLPNNFHQKILSNGDVVSEGNVIGNLFDYIH